MSEKKKSCKRCRHFDRFRIASKGVCGAFIPLPFWVVQKLEIADGAIVNEDDGVDCASFNEAINEPKS